MDTPNSNNTTHNINNYEKYISNSTTHNRYTPTNLQTLQNMDNNTNIPNNSNNKEPMDKRNNMGKTAKMISNTYLRRNENEITI